MAIEDLAKKSEEARVERAKRYQLFEITNNLEEIRDISESTCKYAVDLYPELKAIPEWTIIPRVVMEFIKGAYYFLQPKKDKKITEAFVEVGDFVHFGIEFGTTEGADKDATFNPLISVKSEMEYDNSNASANKLKKTVPNIDMNNDIEFICKSAQNVLKNKFGLFIEDWRAILEIFVSFCRISKDYLIKHKDTEEYGFIINLGEVVDLTIEKYGEDAESPQYVISFGPGKSLKLDYAKGDDKSENND